MEMVWVWCGGGTGMGMSMGMGMGMGVVMGMDLGLGMGMGMGMGLGTAVCDGESRGVSELDWCVVVVVQSGVVCGIRWIQGYKLNHAYSPSPHLPRGQSPFKCCVCVWVPTQQQQKTHFV